MNTLTEKANAMGAECFNKVVESNGQPWVAQAYIDSVEAAAKKKFGSSGNWARRVRSAVENSLGFKAALALCNMGGSN